MASRPGGRVARVAPRGPKEPLLAQLLKTLWLLVPYLGVSELLCLRQTTRALLPAISTTRERSRNPYEALD